MKATLTKTFFQVEKMHKPDACLILEWKVYDLDILVVDPDALECFDIRVYQKGKTYSCCIWIRRKGAIDLAGSGKGQTGQHAVINALTSIGIIFDSELPMGDPYCRPEKMVRAAIEAIAIELEIKYKKVVDFSR